MLVNQKNFVSRHHRCYRPTGEKRAEYYCRFRCCITDQSRGREERKSIPIWSSVPFGRHQRRGKLLREFLWNYENHGAARITSSVSARLIAQLQLVPVMLRAFPPWGRGAAICRTKKARVCRIQKFCCYARHGGHASCKNTGQLATQCKIHIMLAVSPYPVAGWEALIFSPGWVRVGTLVALSPNPNPSPVVPGVIRQWGHEQGNRRPGTIGEFLKSQP